VGGFLVLALVVGAGAAAKLAPEPVLVDHVTKRDAFGPPAAYILGFRGVKLEPTRTALEEALDAVSGDHAAPSDLRAAAAYALATTPTHDALVTLVNATAKDPEPAVRASAVKALGKTGDTLMATTPIRDALDDPNKNVRLAATEGAGFLKVKDARMLDRLVEFLLDPDYDLRRAATHALQEITGEQFGIDHGAWQDWRNQHR
jgi:HEAT repeat protein